MKHETCGEEMSFYSSKNGIAKYACKVCKEYVAVERKQRQNKHPINMMKYGEEVALHLLID